MVLNKETVSEIEKIINKALEKKQAEMSKELSANIIEVLNDKLKRYEEQITITNNNVKRLIEENKKLKMECVQKTEILEQNFKINNLRFHGVPEVRRENLKKVIVDFCKNQLQIDIDATDIDRCRRVGPTSGTKTKHRAILITFARYQTKMAVFQNKKKLKNKKYFIGEDLTQSRLSKYNEAIKVFGKTNAWTFNGTIYVKPNGDDKKIKIYDVYSEDMKSDSTEDENDRLGDVS